MDDNPDIQKEERTWGMLCHLSALSLFLGLPFGNLIGPLLIWLLKRDEISTVDQHGKESLNFQISMTAYLAIAGILCIVLIGIPILIMLLLAQAVLTVVASVKVNNGEDYRYPFTFRLLQ